MAIDRNRHLITYTTSIHGQAYPALSKKKLIGVTEEELIKMAADSMAAGMAASIKMHKDYIIKHKWEVDSITYSVDPNKYYGAMVVKYWESEAEWSRRIKASEASAKAIVTKKKNKLNKDLTSLKKLMIKYNIKSIDDVDTKLSRPGHLISEIQEEQVS